MFTKKELYLLKESCKMYLNNMSKNPYKMSENGILTDEVEILPGTVEEYNHNEKLSILNNLIDRFEENLKDKINSMR